MKVGLVLSGLAPGEVDPRILEAAAAISQRHTVEVWAPPGAVAYVAKRLPSEVRVHHADEAEQRADSNQLRLRRPRALRKTGIAQARVDGVLRKMSVDLVILPTLAQAERAADVLPEGIAVLDWSPNVLSNLTPATGAGEPQLHRVLASGPLLPAARFGDAIRAFDAATSGDDGWTMELQGSGRHEQGLKDLITWRSLEGRVTVASVHQGAMTVGNVRVLVVTSPTAVPAFQALEAAAAGVPVVGFDDSPVVAAVAAAGGGYVVPPHGPDALAAVLKRLLTDDAARARCAERGQDLARRIASASEAERWLLVADLIAQQRNPEPTGQLPHFAPSDQPAPALDSIKTRGLKDLKAAVEQQLAHASVPYAFVAGRDGRDALVVDAEHRETVVHALMPTGASALGGVLPYVGSALAYGKFTTTPDDLPEFADVVDRMRVVGPEHPGHVYVDVELWEADADGVRHAPRGNREAAAVDDGTWREWTERGSRTVTGKPLWEQVTFPIDAVFTWVDGDDPAWQARRDKYLPASDEAVSADEGTRAERFLSRDEIYYAVAAAQKNLPWLRRMIVVTDGQQHERISADFPEVEFVDHRDIFPDPSVLPVFNSHAIEACLHRIPDLAEHFVYFNDDMIVTRPLAPSDLFAANGVARFFASPLTIDFVNSEATQPHLLAAANNRHLLAQDFDVEITNSMLHIPYPHRRSVLEEMEQRYASAFEQTQGSRFRAGQDISVLSSFAQYYGWLTQRYQPGELEYRFVRLNRDALPERIDKVLNDGDVQVVALGEPQPGQEHHPDEQVLVSDFLRRLVS